MKTKNLFLTGALMVTTIIGTSAHDKETKEKQGNTPVYRPTWEVPTNTTNIMESLHSGLVSLEANLVSHEQARQQANVELLLVKRSDMQMTEDDSATDAMKDESFTASLARLTAQQQQQELLTTSKKIDGQMTENRS